MKFPIMILKGVARLVLILYVALTCYGCATFQRAMYPIPPAHFEDSPDAIKLESTDGNLITARFAEAPNAAYTLLYSHGNGMDLRYFDYQARPWLERGINYFAYDYQGYGTSEGNPSEQKTYDDIDAAYRYLTKTRGIAPEKIIVYGFSLGSGVSTDLAMREEVGGLILHSPFLSAYRVVTKHPIIPFDKYRNYKKIDKIDCPLLILHGREDRMIPLFHSQSLYKKANEPKQQLWIDGANHINCVETAGKAYWEQVETLIFGAKHPLLKPTE